MVKSSDNYEIRIKSLIVAPVCEPIFSEKATEISIDDESGGEFIVIRQAFDHAQNGEIRINPGDELEQIFAAVLTLAKQCRGD